MRWSVSMMCVKDKLYSSWAHEKSLALVCDLLDLLLQLGVLVLEDWNSYHISCGSTGSPQSLLALDENVGNILLFAKDGKVEDDFKGVGVSGNDYQLGDASIQCLGCFIGSLLYLFKTCALGDQIVKLWREFFSGEWLGSFGDFLG